MDAFPPTCQVPRVTSVAEFSLHRTGGREGTCMRLIFENKLRLNLGPTISSILENVPWALEKNVYVVAIESSVLPESVRSRWVVMFLPLFLCLSSVCLLYPVLGEEGC